MKLSCP